MNEQILYRILIDLIIFISILNGYWMAALILAVIGMWRTSYFVEMIIAGITYDTLFGMSYGMGYKGYIGTIIASVLTLIFYFGKRVVR